MGGIRRVSLARVSINGEIQAPEVLSADETASHPVIAPMPPESFVVAWTSRANSPSNLSTIRVRLVK